MKSKFAAYAFSFCVFSTLVTLSTTPASAGMYKYRASQGKIMNYVGCPKPDRVAHIMAKHPELYGKPPRFLRCVETTTERRGLSESELTIGRQVRTGPAGIEAPRRTANVTSVTDGSIGVTLITARTNLSEYSCDHQMRGNNPSFEKAGDTHDQAEQQSD